MPNKTHIHTLQIISLFISLIGGAFKFLHYPGANMMLIVGIGTLGICHMVLGFLPASREKKTVYLNYSLHFGISILLYGILFYLMHWQGYLRMIIIGAGSVAISVVAQLLMPDSKEGE